MKALSIISLIGLVLLCGCRARTEYVEAPSVYVYHDTIMQRALRIDSVMVRDSVHVDGQTVYRERLMYKTRLRTDTIYIARTDTVEVTKVITREVEAPARWYDKILRAIGLAAVMALALWLIKLFYR